MLRVKGMHPFPHRYDAAAAASPDGVVLVTGPGLPAVETAAPAEFDGPGDRWSPETMLVGSVATCFVLTFRAVSRAAGLRWDSLTCSVAGTLDRVDRVTQFTAFRVEATLAVPAGTDVEQAQRALARAEQGCLITNSLKAATHLEAKVLVGTAA